MSTGPEMVEVTQAYRDAAAKAAYALEIEWAADGGYFAQLLAQQFAAHRIASLTPHAEGGR